MARMLKPGWTACDKFREIKNNLEITSKEKGVENESGSGSGEPTTPPTRIKTLARATRNEIPAVKAKIKSMLPTLQQTDVRRLQNINFFFFKQLTDIVVQVRAKHGHEPSKSIKKNLHLKISSDKIFKQFVLSNETSFFK